MPDVVFYDAETQSTLSDVGDNFDLLQVSCLCAIAVDADLILGAASSEIEYILQEHSRQLVLWRDEAERGHDPFEILLEWFDNAEAIVSYNGLHFDFPLLRKHYKGAQRLQRYLSHRCKTLDPCKTIEAATGIRTKLDQLLKSNGLETKSANGLEAIDWWNAGQRMKLRSYCMKDVEVMARLVLHNTISMSGVGVLPNAVFGIASFLAAQRCSAQLV